MNKPDEGSGDRWAVEPGCMIMSGGIHPIPEINMEEYKKIMEYVLDKVHND